MLTEGATSAMDTRKTTKEKGPKPMSATKDHYGEDEEPELRAGGAGREYVPVAQSEVDGVHERVM